MRGHPGRNCRCSQQHWFEHILQRSKYSPDSRPLHASADRSASSQCFVREYFVRGQLPKTESGPALRYGSARAMTRMYASFAQCPVLNVMVKGEVQSPPRGGVVRVQLAYSKHSVESRALTHLESIGLEMRLSSPWVGCRPMGTQKTKMANQAR